MEKSLTSSSIERQVSSHMVRASSDAEHVGIKSLFLEGAPHGSESDGGTVVFDAECFVRHTS